MHKTLKLAAIWCNGQADEQIATFVRYERNVELGLQFFPSMNFVPIYVCRLPSRCAPVALDRYSGDEFEHMSYPSSIPRRSPGVTSSVAGVVRAKARAIYAFQAQNRR